MALIQKKTEGIYESSQDNVAEQLSWVKQQIEKELSDLQTDINESQIKKSFFEKSEENNVVYNMDLVKQYLESCLQKNNFQINSVVVMAVQIALESQGYELGKIDGLLKLSKATLASNPQKKSLTENAIIKFQKSNGLKPDGIPGKKTIGKILEILGTTENPVESTTNTAATIQESNEGNPTTEVPAVTNPTTEQPVVTNPITEQPVATNPTTEQPVATNPTTEVPVVTNPTTEQPVVTNPTTEQPVVTNPTTEQPVVTNPITEQPVATNPTTENPTKKTTQTPEPVNNPTKKQTPTNKPKSAADSKTPSPTTEKQTTKIDEQTTGKLDTTKANITPRFKNGSNFELQNRNEFLNYNILQGPKLKASKEHLEQVGGIGSSMMTGFSNYGNTFKNMNGIVSATTRNHDRFWKSGQRGTLDQEKLKNYCISKGIKSFVFYFGGNEAASSQKAVDNAYQDIKIMSEYLDSIGVQPVLCTCIGDKKKEHSIGHNGKSYPLADGPNGAPGFNSKIRALGRGKNWPVIDYAKIDVGNVRYSTPNSTHPSSDGYSGMRKKIIENLS